MRRNLLGGLDCNISMLAICTHEIDGYEQMKYYVAAHTVNATSKEAIGLSEGFLVRNSIGRYDFFEEDEFREIFEVVDNHWMLNKKLVKTLFWLMTVRKFRIKITPNIVSDGYFYEYSIFVGFPFNIPDMIENGFNSYTEAAKRAINLARQGCIKWNGSEGVKKWLESSFLKKR